ncbi:hypothetical protein SAMN02745247_02346 [Butyrivibrio hungatei DSM 14810]|uniref:Uncharacterized protein n=1 Tax=Butyrivibrio hungatei DSM 14810 TaxID=1121132 RepID=A0A1M7SS55_9FIRM|nr:hypothetical protein [Butyrivibrio hungatei]SHN61322.1 hypothetical protein SAMN02745247_02346 [Butyrivibrio hungatei DSM 14810]
MANNKVKILLGIAILLIAGGAMFYKFHPHDYVLFDTKEPTCTEDGYNNYRCWCGTESKEVLEAIGHDYQEEITVEPTCTEEGVDTFTCNNCGDVYTEAIAPLGHSYIDGICERCGELSEEKKKAEEEQKKKEEETKKKQEESKKKEQQSGGGSGNSGGGSSSQKPSGNSGQSQNNVSNETPSNDTSAGAAAWGFGGGSSPTTEDLDNTPTGGIQGE